MAGDRTKAAAAKREALASGRTAVWTATRSVHCLAEAERNVGLVHWLDGKPKLALAWWTRSLETAERLGARLELARTLREVGRRLSDPRGPTREMRGLPAEEYLARADAVFAELGLISE